MLYDYVANWEIGWEGSCESPEVTQKLPAKSEFEPRAMASAFRGIPWAERAIERDWWVSLSSHTVLPCPHPSLQ